MATFIRVDTDDGVIRKIPGLAKKLVEVCPVSIFKLGSSPHSVGIVEENLDECTLCDLCMQACPQGVQVVKLYESES